MEQIRLTRRQLQILARRRRGMTMKEIASELGISPRTVGSHLQIAFRRVGARSSAEACHAARRLLDNYQEGAPAEN